MADGAGTPPTFELVAVVNATPTGACTLPNTLVKCSTGAGAGLYQCIGGEWAKIGGEGEGDLSGTLTVGKYPVASAAHTVVDGLIDQGVTSAGQLTIKDGGPIIGIAISVAGTDGIDITSSGGAGVFVGELDGTGNGTVEVANAATGGIFVNAGGGGGTAYTSGGANKVPVYCDGSAWIIG